MRIIDANILLYAVNRDCDQNKIIGPWFEEILNGSQTVGFPHVVNLAFLRLATKHAIFPTPLSPSEAFEVLQTWLSRPNAIAIEPGERHYQILAELILSSGTAGNLINDAHLAALAIELDCELCSCDYDFARFKQLKWFNPLTACAR